MLARTVFLAEKTPTFLSEIKKNPVYLIYPQKILYRICIFVTK